MPYRKKSKEDEMKLCASASRSKVEPVFVEATLVSGTDTTPPSLLIEGKAVSLMDAERAGYAIAQASREELRRKPDAEHVAAIDKR
jgi:hypothetical protein